MEHLRTNACAVLLYGMSVNCWIRSLSGSAGFRLAEGKQSTEQWSRTGHPITLETSFFFFFADLRSTAYLLWSKCYVLLNAEVLVLYPPSAQRQCEPNRTVGSGATSPLVSCSGQWNRGNQIRGWMTMDIQLLFHLPLPLTFTLLL